MIDSFNWTDISEYRQREIKVILEFISDLLKSKSNPEYTKGAIDLFNKLILIPLDMCSADDEERDYVNNLITKEFEEVKVDLVRKLIFRE